MRLSRRTKAVIWGLSVGTLFTGGWLWLSYSDGRGEPMLMPGQDRSIIVFEELKTGALIFIATSVPVALLVAFRPSARTTKLKSAGGVVFILTGIGVGASALFSGPRAFAFGLTAVVALCIVALILTATGAKMVYDSRHVE